LSQVLFDGSLLVALQARNSIMDLARSTEQMTAENIRYGVHKAYNSLVISYKQFEIIKSSLALARTMEQELIKTREAGFAEKIDVERTSVQINNLATDSLKVANMLTIAEQMLKYQLGMDINAQIILTDTSIEKNTAQLVQLVTEKGSYERVPEYTVLMNALKLNEYDLKRYKLAALPTLAGFTSRGVNFGASTFSGITQLDKYIEYYNGGLSLTVPLFNGFARQYQVREAKLKIEKTRNNIEYTKQSIDFQAATARTTLKNALLQIQSQKRNLDLSNSVLDLAQRKYKAGVGSNLEVTTAQTDLLRSQNNYFAALLEAINAEADLKKALGLLK
jgi:outer membrane protein TolC